MARMLLNLRGVPDDEADEVRELLDRHGIAYYETPPNRWGLSMGAIWVRDDDESERARTLMDDYQRQRRERVREELAEQRRQGTEETFFTLLRRNPGRLLFYLAVAAGILYLSIAPFVHFARG